MQEYLSMNKVTLEVIVKLGADIQPCQRLCLPLTCLA
jgi:hypothetical protein